MRASTYAGVLCALQLALHGCGGNREAARPAPTYERWMLPEWAPPETPDQDPTDGLAEMEGEWVATDEEGDSSPAGRTESADPSSETAEVSGDAESSNSVDGPNDADSPSGADQEKPQNEATDGARAPSPAPQEK